MLSKVVKLGGTNLSSATHPSINSVQNCPEQYILSYNINNVHNECTHGLSKNKIKMNACMRLINEVGH